VAPGDLVITADIPLAAAAIERYFSKLDSLATPPEQLATSPA